MKMNVRAGRILYLLVGTLCLIVVIAKSFHLGFIGENQLLLLSMAITMFCLAYIYPHFVENDERTKKIKERGIFFSFIFIMCYMFILMAIFLFNETLLNGSQTITLLISLSTITVLISFGIMAKRY
ncbi:hypothetical protein [Metabacillus fastidiosus]|uniref:hypothetical protein n=1 Tax=Metabacillus fastidiosus TaxID=1458 RepID=UPI003D2AC216